MIGFLDTWQKFEGCRKGIAHAVSRLGAHEYAARKVFKALCKLPYLRGGKTSVKAVSLRPQDQPTEIDLPMWRMDPYTIAKDACWDNCTGEEVTQTMIRFVRRDVTGTQSNDLRARMKQACSRGSKVDAGRYLFNTWVHAELQILHHFFPDGNNRGFLWDDSYIGISKPSCYFCLLVYKGLKDKFPGLMIPATHNIVCLGVRMPTMMRGSGHIKKGFIVRVKEDIFNTLRESRRAIAQNQSTEGLSLVSHSLLDRKTFQGTY